MTQATLSPGNSLLKQYVLTYYVVVSSMLLESYLHAGMQSNVHIPCFLVAVWTSAQKSTLQQ